MKRAPALRTLSSEHHSALVLARRAALATSTGEAAQAWCEVVERFMSELEPHFRQEEEWLLPALVQAGETVLVQRTLAEHTQLRSLVHESPHDADTLRIFTALLQAHIRFEERELFVVAQARLPGLSLAFP